MAGTPLVTVVVEDRNNTPTVNDVLGVRVFCPSLGANGYNAQPAACQQASGNKWVNPGRTLGSK